MQLPEPVMGNFHIWLAYGVAFQIVALTIAQQVAPGISPDVYVSKFEPIWIVFLGKFNGVVEEQCTTYENKDA